MSSYAACEKGRLGYYNEIVWCSELISSSGDNDSSGGKGVVSQSDLFETAKMYNLEKVGPMLNLR